MRSFSSYLQVLKKDGIKYCIQKAFIKIGDFLTFSIIKTITNKKPLDDCIIIESHNDFDCNGGAFYDYLIQHKINQKYRIVWLIKNPLDRPLPKNVSAFNYYSFSIRKNYFICRAKYLLNDDFYTKKQRHDQISIYCTHGGCTFKNVKGLLDVPDEIDYILSSSEAYDPYMCENYSINYPNNKMLHFGFPSNDILFNTKENEILKLERGEFEKVILWMPTFRTSTSGRSDSDITQPFGIPLITDMEQFEQLNQLLENNKALLIVKIHPMQDLTGVNRIPNLNNIVVLDGKTIKKKMIDTYRLMASAHALLSDYSSATYSYLLLDRPIGFVLSDLDYYKLGFSVPNIEDILPGEKIYSFDDLKSFIRHITSGEDSYGIKRKELLNWLYKYPDGNASTRLFDFLKL